MKLEEQDIDDLLENFMFNYLDVIYFKDLQSRFFRVNEACAKKHGWDSPAFCVGKTDFDLFSKKYAQQTFAEEQRIIKTGETLRSTEQKEIWPDGAESWVLTTKMPLKDQKTSSIIGTLGISRDITAQKKAALRACRYAEEVEHIKEEMEEDVCMAGQLQKNFFPSSYPLFSCNAQPRQQCVEFLHGFKLCREVSGDYCAVIRISDYEVGLFLCDVCGVGVRAALGTALIRGIIQEISASASRPGAYLAQMNNRLTLLLNRSESRPLDVTACYLVLDIRTGLVLCANAGHPMPIHFRDGYTADWLFKCIDCIGPPLALKEHYAYETITQQISEKDSVVMFTDGLYSLKNNMDVAYGPERLLNSAKNMADKPLKKIFKNLQSDALAFSKDSSFSDDVCLIGFNLYKQLESKAFS